jgi:catechol 2,3-dioxygenase-like lactoylglutathione lyase family enzyme
MKLTGLTPNLFTNHLDRSVAFYRDVLGFSVVTTVPDVPPFIFVWLKRDEVSVFVNDAAAAALDLTKMPSVEVGRSGVTIFVHVEGIAELWETVTNQAHVVQPLKEQWYGMTEFSLADPDGYIVTFAERTAAS